MATVIRGDDNFDSAFAKSVAVIADVKAYNGHGGASLSGVWQVRALNTELDDPSNIVTIASNQFTLQAGTYLVEWSAPAYSADRHSTKLYNATDAITEADGTSSYNTPAAAIQTISTGSGVVTITSAKAFEIQHYIQTAKALNGLGVNIESTTPNQNSVYTLVKIHKIGA
tara:strand:+ start:59 stop:568 length:510 start_codon:yes stop_codon:yes gene_type:complete